MKKTEKQFKKYMQKNITPKYIGNEVCLIAGKYWTVKSLSSNPSIAEVPLYSSL